MNIKQQLIKAYDKDAGLRDSRDSAQRLRWKQDEREAFVELLKVEGKQDLLELGSGTGTDAKSFQQSGLNVLATDLSPKMVKECKKKGVEARVLDYESLGGLNKTFDAIFSLNVLLHTPRAELETVLEGISNILNSGGIFYYGVYGGNDRETVINDKTRMGEDRFFSFLSKETILDIVSEWFEVIDYHEIEQDSEEEGFIYQSLTLRKRY